MADRQCRLIQLPGRRYEGKARKKYFVGRPWEGTSVLCDGRTDRHTTVSVQTISIIPLPAYISVLLVRIATKLVQLWFTICGPRNLGQGPNTARTSQPVWLLLNYCDEWIRELVYSCSVIKLVPCQHIIWTIRRKFQTSNTQALLLLYKTMAEPINAAVRRLDVLWLVRTVRLNWSGHVDRMDSTRKISQILNYNPQESRLRGRPKKQMVELCTDRY